MEAGGMAVSIQMCIRDSSSTASRDLSSLSISLARFHSKVGVYEAVNVAVHDRVDVAVLKARPRVLGEGVGHEDVAADGAAEVYLLSLIHI